ncbi:NfeD family protein [Pontibacillus halophilus]|nr:nodulation protein NfeD [Pontibacillus halophilus]
MRRKWLMAWVISLVLIPLLGYSVTADEQDGKGQLVYIVPIEKEVEKGLAAFLKRSVYEAEEAGADHIVFEIDTPGGAVDAAGDIASLFQDIEIPTSAFVINKALSAGSYIALNADEIYMKPIATMGAAGVITSDGNAASQKAQSAWISSMRSAAESNDRDPLYAEAMANKEIDLPEYRAGKGEFLTLDPNEAVEVGYAEGIVEDRVELLSELGLSKATVTETSPTFAENLARFITNPVVVPILLSVASLGFIVELYSPGFGIPGIMGLSSLVLFFYGHTVAGLAGYETIILFVVGLILIVLEFFVPGGILGVIGVGSVVGALFLSSADIGHMALSLAIALMVAIIASVILFKTMGLEKGFLRNIILNDSTSKEKGYVPAVSREELMGAKGVSLTPLRPSGTGDFDGERIDVVTEGSFIPNNSPIEVVKVEGTRVVVRQIKQP